MAATQPRHRSDARDTRLTIRLSAAEHELIREQAEREGYSVSTWLREVALDAVADLAYQAENAALSDEQRELLNLNVEELREARVAVNKAGGLLNVWVRGAQASGATGINNTSMRRLEELAEAFSQLRDALGGYVAARSRWL